MNERNWRRRSRVRWPLVGSIALGAIAVAAFLRSQPQIVAPASRALPLEGTGRRLVCLNRQGRVTAVLGEPARYLLPRISPDGRQVAVARMEKDGTGNIWLFEIATGRSYRVTHERLRASYPVWSPDGNSLAYAAWRKNNLPQLAFVSLTGGKPPSYAIDRRFALPTDWSGAAHLIVFEGATLAEGVIGHVWAVSSRGAPLVLVEPRAEEVEGRISPNGRWLAYASNASRRWEVYARSLLPQSGAAMRISAGGGSEPRWRSDGRELFYLNSARELVAVPVDGSPGQAPFGAPEVLFDLRDVTDGSRTYSYAPAFGYCPSADGQSFVAVVDEGRRTGSGSMLRR